MTGAHVHESRRAGVAALLGDRGALVLTAAPELLVGRDTELRYAPDADLYYLTGCVEPESVLVLCPSHAEPYTLFVRERDPAREQWTGARLGPAGAHERFGADAVYPIRDLHERLPRLLEGVDVLYMRIDAVPNASMPALAALVAAGRRRRARHGTGIHTVVEPGVLLDEMRLYKDASEVERIREAARISVAGFEAARCAIRDGTGEWEVEAALEGTFRARGGSGPAFPSIVASGPNATVLHYIANERRMAAGDLVLLDAGARAAMYCADISRTYAVGPVSADTRALHDVVRSAHERALAAARPGATIGSVHTAATDALAEGLVALGLLDPGLDGPQRAEALRRYCPHQTSHWLGLDVHDVGDYLRDGVSRPLEAGMVFTVEPGLYIPGDAADVPEALRGIGIRIEDDVLITADGADVLTAALSTKLEE